MEKKKSIFKKWWLWVIVAAVIVSVAAIGIKMSFEMPDKWPDDKYTQLIPSPTFSVKKLYVDDYKLISKSYPDEENLHLYARAYENDKTAYNTYLDACKGKGFVNDALEGKLDNGRDYYIAADSNNNVLAVEYIGANSPEGIDEGIFIQLYSGLTTESVLAEINQ